MPVSRAKYRGTHLENAPQWMLEIEEMARGGWSEGRGGPRWTGGFLIAEKKPVRGSSKRAERAVGSRPLPFVPRQVRVSEPRWAPRPTNNVRAHHFEHKTILASRTKGASVAEARAGYTLAFGEGDGVIEGKVRATDAAQYMEGTTSSEAERVVHITGTNGATNEERMRFWKLANENAHFVGEHKIRVSVTGLEPEWGKAAKDPTMPQELRSTLAEALSGDGSAERTVNDAGVVKRWMRRSRRLPAELLERVELTTPKNGRVAHSLIGQFPHDMSLGRMKRCLDELGSELTKRSIPYQAVIHEPTAKNSKKNWHFHLIYYAGPAELLDNGRWSFEREWRRNKYRTDEWVPLKRMQRHEDIGDRFWVPKLKDRWRDIVNAQAAQEGLAIRFTNETNAARGLGKPQTRYSPGRQALHKKGFFTERDVENMLASWTAYKKRKRKAAAKRIAKLRAAYDRLSMDSRLDTLPSSETDPILDTLDLCEADLNELARLIDMKADAAVLREMLMSGPTDTDAYYASVEDDLASKKATRARKDKAAFAREVREEVGYCLEELAPVLSNLSVIERSSERHIATLETLVAKDLVSADAEVARVVARTSDKASAQSAHAAHNRSSELHKAELKPEMAAARAAFLSSSHQM